MSGRKWSELELKMLRELYPTKGWPVLLREFPGRTKAAIRCQVIKLGIRRLKNSRVPWTFPERELLRKLWPHAPWAELLQKLPRHTQGAIGRQASQLKLRRDPSPTQSRYQVVRTLRAERRKNGMTLEALAEKIGAHSVQLSRWECGHQLPRLRSFFDWIEALGYRLELVRGIRQ